MGENKQEAEREDNTITPKVTRLDGSAKWRWWPPQSILFMPRRKTSKQVKENKALPPTPDEVAERGKWAKKLRLLTFTAV